VSYGVHPHSRPAKALTLRRLAGKKLREAGCSSIPSFLTNPGLNSPVAKGGGSKTAAHRVRQEPSSKPENLPGRVGGCGLLSTSRTPQPPHDDSAVQARGLSGTKITVGTSALLSSAQASGWRDSEEGGRSLRVSSRGSCQIPNPAAGFRRRALFRGIFVAN
jgi:hypothetical protein